MRTAAVLLLSVVPGVLAWWWGRRLAALADDAALPERLAAYRSRLGRVTITLLVLATVVAHEHVVWGAPLALATVLAGGFPARKALLREEWGLFAYLSHVVRLALATAGFWMLLAAAPALVHAAGTFRWPVVVLLAALLLAWNAAYPRVFLALVHARPLDRPDLHTCLTAVIERARTAAPRLYRAGTSGGRWANAFAFPTTGTPSVLFTNTLLDLFAPDELAAVFAHEVAHLEHYDRRRLFRWTVVNWVAIALGLLVVPLLMVRFEGWAGVLGWTWALLVVLFLVLKLASHKAHEAESDRRAVVLCGDPEALARALVKLHVLARLPRRLEIDLERAASHPSLAHRIQAIRAGVSAPPGLPVVLSSSTLGALVILDADRVHRLEGVPPDAPADPATLRDRAAVVQSIAYPELVDLRVRAPLAGEVLLVATDRAGRSWSVPLRPESVAAAQAALDAVDARLGRSPAGLLHHPAVPVMVASAIVIVSIASGNLGVAVPLGLLALFRPAPVPLAATGITAIAGVLLALRDPIAGVFTPALHSGALATLAGLGGVIVWLALARRRTEGEPHGVATGLTLAVLGIAAIPAWSALLWVAMSGAGGLRLHQAARAAPSATVALLGLAGALLLVPRRPARWAAAIAAILAVVPLGLGAGWFHDRFGYDPLATAGPALRWSGGSLRVVGQARGVGATGLRLSPSGREYAVRSLPRPEGRRWLASFLIGRFDGGHREIEAYDLAFLGDGKVLALAYPGPGPEPELRVAALDDLADSGWHRTLPRFAVQALSADPATGAWRVSGWGSPDDALVVISGHVGRDAVATTAWRHPGRSESRGVVVPGTGVAL
ncbi:MAG TPA: M48 family metalloprotease, partial [Methylomirabilota bacterium]|nr:M48 family metalloprotease [Methylomirabilota bacterium]